MGRSVHQGGPNSSYLFLVCTEVLACALRGNQGLQGIPIQNIMNLFGQYADDMDMYLRANSQNLQFAFETFQWFRMQSGFTINYQKTTVYRIGSIKDSDAMFYTEKDLCWTNGPINILGVFVHHSLQKTMEANYRPIVEKSKAILNAWSHRKLSLIGKILIVNTLVASLFVYRMTVLPSIPSMYVNQMNNLIKQFLWEQGKAKIAFKTLQSHKKCSGLGLVNLEMKDISLKISWIQVIQSDESMAAIAYHYLNPQLRELIWKCNINPKEVHSLNIKSSFWKDVLYAWSMVHYQIESQVESPGDQVIWLNSAIKISGSIVWWSHIFKRGLKFTSQLFTNNQLISCGVANASYGLSIMEYNSLVSAIPLSWWRILRSKSGNQMVKARDIPNKYLTPHVAYQLLTQKEDVLHRKRIAWEDELGMIISTSLFNRRISDIWKVTNIAKYCSFQYRLLHRSLPTNQTLYKWGIKSSPLCTFCQSEEETYPHLFVMCHKVRPIWLELEKYMNISSEESIIFGIDRVICNKFLDNSAYIKNFVCLVAKHYIYKQKCLGQSLRFSQLKSVISSLESTEKYYAIKNGVLHKHLHKWHPQSSNQTSSRVSTNEFVAQYLHSITGYDQSE